MEREEVYNRTMHAVSKVIPGDKVYMSETIEHLRLHYKIGDMLVMLENEFGVLFSPEEEAEIFHPTNTLISVVQKIHHKLEDR